MSLDMEIQKYKYIGEGLIIDISIFAHATYDRSNTFSNLFSPYAITTYKPDSTSEVQGFRISLMECCINRRIRISDD